MRIVLLDGGTGLELLSRSANKAPRHWSSEYLTAEPDLVRNVHLDYIRAGAKVITVNSYSSTFTRMAMVDAAERVPELQALACDLARAARDQAGAAGSDVAIAGCLPPLNGTYRPDRVRDFETDLEEYRRLAALQAPRVDLFLCETMSTAQEARAAALAAAEHGKPAWSGWSLMDDAPRLRSGERIGAAMAALQGIAVSAALANCSPPESVCAAMPELVATGLAAGGYANGFTRIPATFLPGKTRAQLQTRGDLDPDAYAEFVLRWVRDGASIVGGCCERLDDVFAAAHAAVEEQRIVGSDGGADRGQGADRRGRAVELAAAMVRDIDRIRAGGLDGARAHRRRSAGCGRRAHPAAPRFRASAMHVPAWIVRAPAPTG